MIDSRRAAEAGLGCSGRDNRAIEGSNDRSRQRVRRLKNRAAAGLDLVAALLRNERGLESLEWLTVGAVVVAAALIAWAVEVSPAINDAAHRLRLSLP